MKRFFIRLLALFLKFLAVLVLKRHKPEIIAITGSVAKSSTKEAIYQVLKKRFREVGKSFGNLNTKLGLPLAILGFKRQPNFWEWPLFLFLAFFKVPFLLFTSYPKILVLEIAADLPSDFSFITSYLKPKIAVVTAIGPAHLEFFKTEEGVFKEKSKLVSALPKDGFALLNKDDKWVKKMKEKTKAKVRFFKGDDLIKNATKEVAKIYGIKISPKIPFLPHRMNILKTKSGAIILDDCYNANPLSMEYALKQFSIFNSQFSRRRKIAVLGDMYELGDYQEKGHQEVGKKARKASDLLITVGQYSKAMGGHFHFENNQQAIEFLLKEIKKGDIVLIKASRAMKFEEIVEGLIK